MIKAPVASIISGISSAASRWCDRSFARRQTAIDAVCERTGYSTPVVDHAFDALFEPLQYNGIAAIIADELGCIDVLDDFCDRPGRPRARALPIGRVGIISSRTTVGVAIVPAIFAACAKCEIRVKDREDFLVAAFFDTVIEEVPHLQGTLSAGPWNGEADARRLSDCDALVAFGSDATLERVARELPRSTKFIGYGSRASAGYVTREALTDEASAHAIARRIAHDVVLYDTQGCLSLHVLFVEPQEHTSIVKFANFVAEAIDAIGSDFPVSRRDEQRQAHLAMARDEAAFASPPESVYSDSESSFLVLVDTSGDRPPPFVARSVAICEVSTPAQASHYLQRHGITLEGFAVADRRPDVLETALHLGVCRITQLGMLQHPPLGEFHGGRPRIAEFVRWVTDET